MFYEIMLTTIRLTMSRQTVVTSSCQSLATTDLHLQCIFTVLRDS